MKAIMFLIVGLMSLGFAAKAETVFCLAATVAADGSLRSVSNNAAQVVVLKDGAISMYSLKDNFSLFRIKYKITSPFPMSHVRQYGIAGTYSTSGDTYAANFNASAVESDEIRVDFSASNIDLAGKISVELYQSGRWAGTSMDNLKCSTAGIN